MTRMLKCANNTMPAVNIHAICHQHISDYLRLINGQLGDDYMTVADFEVLLADPHAHCGEMMVTDLFALRVLHRHVAARRIFILSN